MCNSATSSDELLNATNTPTSPASPTPRTPASLPGPKELPTYSLSRREEIAVLEIRLEELKKRYEVIDATNNFCLEDYMRACSDWLTITMERDVNQSPDLVEYWAARKRIAYATVDGISAQRQLLGHRMLDLDREVKALDEKLGGLRGEEAGVEEGREDGESVEPKES